MTPRTARAYARMHMAENAPPLPPEERRESPWAGLLAFFLGGCLLVVMILYSLGGLP